jgi:hypothetical protein
MQNPFFLEIDYSLLPRKGQTIWGFSCIRGSCSQNSINTNTCALNIHFSDSFYAFAGEVRHHLEIKGIGEEDTIFGDRFGFEIKLANQSKEKSFEKNGLSYYLRGELSAIEVVYVFGQRDRPEPLDEYVKHWRKENYIIPDDLTVFEQEMQTVDYIVFRLVSGKWIYISSGGPGSISVELDIIEAPNQRFWVHRHVGATMECIFASEYDEYSEIDPPEQLYKPPFD